MNEELIQIGDLLRTQDNRITADPIFLVQQRVRIYGIDIDYNPATTWMCMYADEPYEVPPAIAEALEAVYQKDGEDEPEGYQRVGYIERWEYVQPFFTEKAADDYIARMAHRYCGPLRTFVDSAYRNYEWQAVRNYLMEVHPVDKEVSK